VKYFKAGAITISAKSVILATGGAGRLYLRHDNPKRMLGDGYVLALIAGAILQNNLSLKYLITTQNPTINVCKIQSS
jgi:aspartate oxidase